MRSANQTKKLSDDDIRSEPTPTRRSLLAAAGLGIASAAAAVLYGVKTAGAKDTDQRHVKNYVDKNDYIHFRDPK